jgi:hypothetical protein
MTRPRFVGWYLILNGMLEKELSVLLSRSVIPWSHVNSIVKEMLFTIISCWIDFLFSIDIYVCAHI